MAWEVSLAVEVMEERGDEEESLSLVFLGVRVKSIWSHQSSSVHWVMPQEANHFLLPRGTKKWAFGCVREISTTVGWDRWS